LAANAVQIVPLTKEKRLKYAKKFNKWILIIKLRY